MEHWARPDASNPKRKPIGFTPAIEAGNEGH
jgi:hypothetical protein